MPIRRDLPSQLLALLPFTLFFPIGVMYVVLGLFLIAWLSVGDLSAKWARIRPLPVLLPILVGLAIVLLDAAFLSAENTRRWSGAVYYLIFIFFLVFVSTEGGDWQRRGQKVFFAGALYGSSVFFLAKLNLLPDWHIFKNYLVYAGNKSIALGIFLSVAAPWILYEALLQRNRKRMLMQLAAYAYISCAVLLLATTRTGIVLLILLTFLTFTFSLRSESRTWFAVAAMALVLIVAWQFGTSAKQRMMGTVEAVQALSQGQSGTGSSNRLQFIDKTSEMIREKPLLGHGIGSWQQQYPVRAQGLETANMSTPHNDYLLYAAELGAVGLLILLWIYSTLIQYAFRVCKDRPLGPLLVLTAIIVGGMFNAILRDWRFGVPMMILLAIAFGPAKAKSEQVAVSA